MNTSSRAGDVTPRPQSADPPASGLSSFVSLINTKMLPLGRVNYFFDYA